ncbi:MAG: hypothetical protein IPM29_00935 [Planctomycetes bacterium]|nr:hypothetical protein [Planctomycetota bacterium]
MIRKSILLAVLLAVLATAQEPRTGPACPQCNGRGETDCTRHRDVDVEREHAVEHCSVATRCRSCAGALTVDCKACRNEVVEAAAAARREAAAAWLAARHAEFDRHLVKAAEVEYLDTPHAQLVFGLDDTRIGRTRIGRHERMHLYGERVEALRVRFMEALELDESAFPPASDDVDPILHLCLFSDPRDQLAVGPRVTGIGTQGASVKLMGTRMAWSMAQDPRVQRDDTDVYRSMVHNVSHLLLSGMEPVCWIGNRGHGWIDEGVAHWFEYYVVDQTCANFCYEEVALTPGTNYEHGYWRVALRQLVERGGLLKFVDLYQKNSDELDLKANAHAFGWIDFLISTQGGASFARFLRSVKGGAESRDALREVYGFGPLEFDERFATWVRATYPLKRGE